jgi:Tol biopolymer transport system component/predicted Ser/Thr protein kinase
MGLTSGTKLGPYEIQSPLGAGGMGEVYRARDTRLGRDIAIKVLPQHLSSNPDLKQRFEREARAISSLNHPHICTLHDVGHQDGVDFLVMEYLEGETLAQRLKKGPLPLKETLKIGIEICEALDKAHRAGIIHRDLKPGNVMLTRNGAKLMDFGLAKAAGAGLGSASSSTPLLSAAQTMSEASPMSPLTTAGAMIGTIQYMAPEQIEGKEADARSDIFAFGAVLYEMTTGKRPFEGKSQISVASAILEKEPERISAHQPFTPAAFEHVVSACLAKNPEDRFQTAHDVKLELKWISENGAQLVAPEASEAHAKARPQVLPWAVAATAVVLLLLTGGAFLLGRRNLPPVHYRMVSYREGILQTARFSHDGQTIVYSGQWEGDAPLVTTARIGSPESRPLGIPPATVAAVSSTDELAVIEGCEYIFLVDCGGTLASVNLSGGAPRELAEHVAYADWSPDSKQLAIVVDASNDARLEFPPGHVLYRQNSGWLGHPRFSPDGTMIAFENHPIDSDDGSIDVVDLQGKRRVITQGWLSIEGLAWRPDGKEIWFAGTTNTAGWADAIHAVTLSGKERTVLTVPWVRLHDIAPDGRVLLSRENWRSQLIGLFPGDKAEHPYSWLDDTTPTALSSDGQWLSFAESGEVYYLNGDRLAYYRRTDGSAAVSVGVGQAAISPDGKWILTYGRGSKILLQPVGAGETRELPTPGLTVFDNLAWSDDGRQIAYEALTSEGDWNVYTQKIDGGPPVLLKAKGRNSGPALSPDGATVALHQDGGGIALYPAGGGKPVVVKGATAAEFPVRFMEAGRSLLVIDNSAKELALTVVDLASGRRQLWKRLSLSVQRKGKIIAVTPDLKYYAYYSPRYSSDLYLVENLH